MTPIKAIIIDDEPKAIDVLKRYCEQTDFIDLLATFRDPVKALSFLQDEAVALLFLDINMPLLSGMELLNVLKVKPKIIFTTAYSEYALDSYDHDALDYLLKPIDLRELRQSFHRYYSIGKLEKMQRINYFLYQWQNADRDSKIALPEKEGTIYQEIQDIIYCQAFNNYTKFYFVNRQPVLVANTLKEYENLLAQNGFIRIHQSYLVNVHHVTELNSHDPSLIIHGQIKLPIALARRKEVRMQMQKFVK